ncbi:hypothetical protein [Frankia sp. AiPa1]|uniref:hypothetical protein n=1 Tax=Frankia sp. AiPa1 TaxID=573492 RepID=UPI00202B409B|nr:hypothetical protein [Frankia sp. AiPa1]MCL9762419.1 hypothetical protein [Frankia sp. AiPa1]
MIPRLAVEPHAEEWSPSWDYADSDYVAGADDGAGPDEARSTYAAGPGHVGAGGGEPWETAATADRWAI